MLLAQARQEFKLVHPCREWLGVIEERNKSLLVFVNQLVKDELKLA